jgi:acyl carrier protein phosphodiesterase
VSKQKNKNSKKSREAKKRKRAIKRKVQIRSMSSGNIQAQHPLEYTSKLSEVVLKFAEPLTDAVEGTEGEEKAIRMSITLWNASLLPKQKALETIRPAFDDMAKGDQVLKSKFHSMFDMMYERKQNYFSADNRFIVDYRLEENREGFYLQVASTPLKT